jgi:hypothetical protein
VRWRPAVEKRLVGSGIPPAYALSLIAHESRGDPDLVNPVSRATGLLQVTWSPLQDWNRQNDAVLALEDVRDPEMNLSIGLDHLEKIVTSYAKHHKATLATDWKDPRFVGLVTLGWNAGHSEKSGVGYVVSRLEEAGIPPERITATAVQQAANRLEKASRFLKDPERLAWVKRTVASYVGSPEGDRQVASTKSRYWPWLLGGAAVFGGILLYRMAKKQALLEEREEKRALSEGPAAMPFYPCPPGYGPPGYVPAG